MDFRSLVAGLPEKKASIYTFERGTAVRLTVHAHARLRIRTDDLLQGLTATERDLVIGQRTGYTVPELAEHVGLGEDAVRELLAAANKVVRRSSRRLAASRA